MLKSMALAGLLPALLLSSPALALTKEEKTATCTFGANDQKLTGDKRKAFMTKCMSNRDEKRGAVMPAAAPPAAKRQ